MKESRDTRSVVPGKAAGMQAERPAGAAAEEPVRTAAERPVNAAAEGPAGAVAEEPVNTAAEKPADKTGERCILPPNGDAWVFEPAAPPDRRWNDLTRTLENPDCFRLGDLTVCLDFSREGPSLEQLLLQYLQEKRANG